MKNVFIFVLFFLANTTMSNAANGSCISHEQLNKWTEQDLADAVPCTFSDSLFLLPFVRSFERFELSGSAPAYYVPARWYLTPELWKSIDPSQAKELLQLQLEIGLISELNFEMPDDPKLQAYSAFLVLERGLSIAEAPPDAPVIFNGTFEIAYQALKALMTNTGVVTVNQLRCFVRYDHPEFTMSDILESRMYSECVEAAE